MQNKTLICGYCNREAERTGESEYGQGAPNAIQIKRTVCQIVITPTRIQWWVHPKGMPLK